MTKEFKVVDDPNDFYRGHSTSYLPPTPQNIIIFTRKLASSLVDIRNPIYYHHRYVLIINRTGTMGVVINGYTYKFKPGNIILIPPFSLHYFKLKKTQRVDLLFITFDAQLEHNFLSSIQPLEEGSFEDDVIDEIIERYTASGNPDDEQIAQFQALIAFLLLKFNSPEAEASKHYDINDKLLLDINEALSGDCAMSIMEISRQLGFSESTLRRKFSQHAGCSLGDYIQKYKLNRALRLMNSSEDNLTEIAFQSGYDSIQSFSRFFKKATGYSPRAYMKIRQ